MNDTFFDSLDELYHRAKIGEDVQRAPAVCENRVFDCLYVCFLSRSEAGALFVRGGHTLNRCCVTVYGWILILFTSFSPLIALSNALGSTYFSC